MAKGGALVVHRRFGFTLSLYGNDEIVEGHLSPSEDSRSLAHGDR